jgi:ABC-type multidrug transport system permease subunit
MGHRAGLALKSIQWFIRFVQFCCCAVVLALFSYFLAHLHRNNQPINNNLRAVEGISGLGVLYTLLALIFLCCVAGIIFTSAIAILLDILFAGAFIYIAT